LSEQLGLPGLGRDAAFNHRLFFALLPQPPDASRIFQFGQRLRAESGLQGMPVPADRLHVSLHGFGDHPSLPERLVDAACRAGDALAAPQFEIAFDCAGASVAMAASAASGRSCSARCTRTMRCRCSTVRWRMR
jgi:hypothetical protein